LAAHTSIYETAMIKDLVVNLTVGAERDVVAQFALSVAQTFEAHIAGLAFAYEPVIVPTVMDGMSAAWVDIQRSENRAAAQKAIDRFREACDREGLSTEHRLIEASLGAAAGLFGRTARHFDLAVVGQMAPDRLTSDALFIEAALFESGRPALVVPYIQEQGLRLEHVLACWDGSRNAARAIADAMPFLRRSKIVEIMMVAGRDCPADEVPGADIAEHLARHGLAVEVKRLVAADISTADAILSYAADGAADLIVMGGYGHSRLREFVLGGATRGMLDKMTLPVLMSH
jgi:nucleotide-binding universal stress UspA family protein